MERGREENTVWAGVVLDIPPYQHTYDLTDSISRSEAFQKSSACVQHGYGADMMVCAVENERVSESHRKIILKKCGGGILFAFRIVKNNDFGRIS